MPEEEGSHVLSVRLSDAEYQLLRIVAGVTPISTFVRKVVIQAAAEMVRLDIVEESDD